MSTPNARKWFLPTLFAAALTAAAAQAAPVGTTVDSKTLVTGSGSSAGTREIVKDSPIFRDDRLKANKTGMAQIILVDGTRIVVGPNAQIDITDYAYDDASKDSFKHITIRAMKGTFRVITGKSKPSAFSIVTPAGTIGVRG